MPYKDPKEKMAYLTKYESSPEQKKRRAARGRARYALEKAHGKATLDGKEVDHKDRNPNNKSRDNLRVVSRRQNRTRKR